MLSHYLHNNDCIGNEQNKKEILYTIREFLERKKSNKEETITEEYVMKVAENPVEYSLFSDFLGFPSQVLNLPNLLLLICLRVMGGFRLAMQAQGGKCVFSSEWNKYATKTLFGERSVKIANLEI